MASPAHKKQAVSYATNRRLIIDTLPLPICKLARRYQRKIFKTDPVFEFPLPTKGYCAAKQEFYFGFKGGIRITDYGLIVQAPILQAYGHDKQCREPLIEGTAPGTQVFGDSAFIGLDWQKECMQNYQIRIQTPLKSNMKFNPQRVPFVLKRAENGMRRLVETVYAQLTERFHVARLKVRDAWHLQNLWNTKILTHTLCVFFNLTHKREPLDFEGLVTFLNCCKCQHLFSSDKLTGTFGSKSVSDAYWRAPFWIFTAITWAQFQVSGKH